MRYFDFVKSEELDKYTFELLRLPQRATKYSAGYDFYSPTDFTIEPNDIAIIPTGVKVIMPNDEVLKIYIRSSLALNHEIHLNGSVTIIDADYANNPNNDGNIFIGLKNFGNKSYTVNKGERIAQGIFEKYLTVDNDNVETKRVGGIGSTNVG